MLQFINKHHFLFVGMPFIASLLGATYVLGQYQKIRLKEKERKHVVIENQTFIKKDLKLTSLEQEYEKMVTNTRDYEIKKVL